MIKHSRLLIKIFYGMLILVSFHCNKKEACLTCSQPPTDTTSHHFTWTTQTLGDGSSSVLYDVAILNDTLAYAVGEIRIKDSLGNWQYPPYSVAKWNGSKWELITLYYNSTSPIFPIRGILVVSPNDIWLAAGSIFHWNGVDSIASMSFARLSLPDPNATIEKLWGNTSSSIYGVGNAGTIVSYNGSSWAKIESGTTLSINDIYGGYNSVTKQWEILAVASNNYPLNKTIIRIQGNVASTISSDPIQYELYGVWFVPCQRYYVIGDGIYEKNSLTETVWKNNPLDITNYATTKIKGNTINDVFVCGAYGELLHFNGSTWYSYMSTTNLPNGSYTSIAVRNNLVIAVGGDPPLAAIAIGRR